MRWRRNAPRMRLPVTWSYIERMLNARKLHVISLQPRNNKRERILIKSRGETARCRRRYLPLSFNCRRDLLVHLTFSRFARVYWRNTRRLLLLSHIRGIVLFIFSFFYAFFFTRYIPRNYRLYERQIYFLEDSSSDTALVDISVSCRFSLYLLRTTAYLSLK